MKWRLIEMGIGSKNFIKKKKKQFVIFGMGRFGQSVAKTLTDSGCEVLVVDNDADKIQDMAEIVTHAVVADVTDTEELENLGIRNFDGAIIGIGKNLEASVMATILVKELEIDYVLAKANNEMHGKILKKVGADTVIFPEKEMGIRIANNVLMGNFFDAVELSTTFSMMEVEVLDSWAGHSLQALDLRRKYKINVVAVKKNDDLRIDLDPTRPLTKDEVLIVIGKNQQLHDLAQKSKAENEVHNEEL